MTNEEIEEQNKEIERLLFLYYPTVNNINPWIFKQQPITVITPNSEYTKKFKDNVLNYEDYKDLKFYSSYNDILFNHKYIIRILTIKVQIFSWIFNSNEPKQIFVFPNTFQNSKISKKHKLQYAKDIKEYNLKNAYIIKEK